MNYVGIDLHKKTIVLCVVNKDRQVLDRKKFNCRDTEAISDYFRSLGPFQFVVKATAAYYWLVGLLEPLAERVVLAHPKKLRVIAETTRKTDKLDAQVLAEFLALDMIPEAYRPSPRERAYRRLVRHRQFVQSRITSIKNKIRNVLAGYNADREQLFTRAGLAYLKQVPVGQADRFVLDQLRNDLIHFRGQLTAVDKELEAFRERGPQREQEARMLLGSIPQVGPVTSDAVLSELGDVRRFRNAKQVCAYAGLVPGVRESAGKRKDKGITKEGSRMLRWVLVEAAWRLKNTHAKWGHIYEQLHKRCGKKKAIVAVARKLLCVIYAMLRDGTGYGGDMTLKKIREFQRWARAGTTTQ